MQAACLEANEVRGASEDQEVHQSALLAVQPLQLRLGQELPQHQSSVLHSENNTATGSTSTPTVMRTPQSIASGLPRMPCSEASNHLMNLLQACWSCRSTGNAGSRAPQWVRAALGSALRTGVKHTLSV